MKQTLIALLVGVSLTGCSAAGGTTTPLASTTTTTGAEPQTTLPPATTTSHPSSTTTTIEPTFGLGKQPEFTSEIVSPDWVTDDWEDMGELIEAAAAGEAIDVSPEMTSAVIDNLSTDSPRPYLYRATHAGDLVAGETLAVQLTTGDSATVVWWYVWADTPPCDICEDNQVRWDNGWDVWTDPEPDRGIVVFYAHHPELPLQVRVAFAPDPVEWPEADPADHPVLDTSPTDAAAMAAAILDTLAKTIPVPST